MIPRVRRLLIQKLHGLPIQPHKLPLEAQIIKTCGVIPVIILEEQIQAVNIVEKRPFDRYLLHVRGLRERERLRRRLLRRGPEVQVVFVGEEFEGLWCGVVG